MASIVSAVDGIIENECEARMRLWIFLIVLATASVLAQGIARANMTSPNDYYARSLTSTVRSHSSNYYMSKRLAIQTTREVINTEYGYNRYKISVNCKPQFHSYWEPNILWHRASCWWVYLDDSNSGRLTLIAHSDGTISYNGWGSH